MHQLRGCSRSSLCFISSCRACLCLLYVCSPADGRDSSATPVLRKYVELRTQGCVSWGKAGSFLPAVARAAFLKGFKNKLDLRASWWSSWEPVTRDVRSNRLCRSKAQSWSWWWRWRLARGGLRHSRVSSVVGGLSTYLSYVILWSCFQLFVSLSMVQKANKWKSNNSTVQGPIIEALITPWLSLHPITNVLYESVA